MSQISSDFRIAHSLILTQPTLSLSEIWPLAGFSNREEFDKAWFEWHDAETPDKFRARARSNARNS